MKYHESKSKNNESHIDSDRSIPKYLGYYMYIYVWWEKVLPENQFSLVKGLKCF